jgi:DNA-binding NarL/FixJ family response regulator
MRPSIAPNIPRTAVLLDPQPLWRYGVESVLRRIGVDVVAKTETADGLAALIRELEPDVLVAETQVPGRGPPVLPALRDALEERPELKIVVLSESGSQAQRAAAFEAGAVAYVVKTTHPDDIASAIRQAFQHSVFFADHQEQPTRQEPAHAPVPRSAAHTDTGSDLTPRETEILRLVAQGRSNGEIARALWVTEQTVKFHLSNIYRKLNVANRTEASRWAFVHELLGPPEEDDAAAVEGHILSVDGRASRAAEA